MSSGADVSIHAALAFATFMVGGVPYGWWVFARFLRTRYAWHPLARHFVAALGGCAVAFFGMLGSALEGAGFILCAVLALGLALLHLHVSRVDRGATQDANHVQVGEPSHELEPISARLSRCFENVTSGVVSLIRSFIENIKASNAATAERWQSALSQATPPAKDGLQNLRMQP